MNIPMETFHWITATVGMVMALGMTRLLNAGVMLFRSRGRARMDWVPIVWSVAIFYSMLDFSWDLRQPSGVVAEWTFARSLALLVFALTLFVAAALILPPAELAEGEGLRHAFDRDGRWALAFIAGYDFLCIFFNWFYWHMSPMSVEGTLNATLCALALIAIRTKSRRLETVACVVYTIIILSSAFFMT